MTERTPSSASSSVSRLWRPAAQRNLRNQWSKLYSLTQNWTSSSSSARTHATSLVNAFLSLKYMPSMELGLIGDMPCIREKASVKLCNQQERHRSNLSLSYNELAVAVTQMVRTSKSMRYYLKGSSVSPLVQFSGFAEDENDLGDGGDVPVFASWSVSCFEKFAQELVQMHVLELNLKRLLVVELISISCEPAKINKFNWSDELYPGEFEDLRVCQLFSEESSEPVFPRLGVLKSDKGSVQCHLHQPNLETLQVYLSAWIAEVNIDTYRVDEIFAKTGEEMHVKLS